MQPNRQILNRVSDSPKKESPVHSPYPFGVEITRFRPSTIGLRRRFSRPRVVSLQGLWLCLWGVRLAECLLQVLGSVWGWLCGYLQQVDGLGCGRGLVVMYLCRGCMQISKTKQMYREHNKGLLFPSEHCWNVLKYQPKWSAECEKKKPKRVRSHVQSIPSTPSTASTPDMINIEADMTCDIVDPMERPIGRKVEKEKRRKLNANASIPIVDLLVAMQEERKSTSERKLEILDKSYVIQAEKT